MNRRVRSAMRVLIVDDDHDQLEIRSLLLERAGFQAVSAATCDEALAAAELAPCDCALLDLHLPDRRSGLQLVRMLKELHPAIHILVLTGYSRERLSSFPERALIDEVIEKGSSASLIEKLTSLASFIKHSSVR